MNLRVNNILFPSNLSNHSRHAFNYAAMLATQFSAKIIMLHVIEKVPNSTESRIRGLFGEDKWRAIVNGHIKDARQILVGKMAPRQMVHAALSEFCRDAGIDSEECGYVDREIIVTEGDIVETILSHVDDFQCDLVVMGASKGIITGTSIGHVIKPAIKKSKVPVMVIPPLEIE